MKENSRRAERVLGDRDAPGLFLETSFRLVAEAGPVVEDNLEPQVLPRPPQCRDYRCALPDLVSRVLGSDGSCCVCRVSTLPTMLCPQPHLDFFSPSGTLSPQMTSTLLETMEENTEGQGTDPPPSYKSITSLMQVYHLPHTGPPPSHRPSILTQALLPHTGSLSSSNRPPSECVINVPNSIIFWGGE